MIPIDVVGNVKSTLVRISLLCCVCAVSFGQIVFEHIVIDQDAIGHREVGDIDQDGFNDIAAVNYPMLVWYEQPNWEKHLIVDISKFDDYRTYRSCDMELAYIDGDMDLITGGDRRWVWKSFLRGHQPIYMDRIAKLTGDKRGDIPGAEGVRRAMGVTRRLAERVNLAAMTPRPELVSTADYLADPGPSAASITKLESEKPYRVLVVIGDQWDDPGSYCIDAQSRFYQLPARQSGKDFLDVVTMLKIWGIPFDILRLDQQRLQINRFLNGVAEPNYRCVIWMADPDKLQGYSAHYETLRRVVEDYGISLIVLFDCIRTPEVAELVGIKLEGEAAAAAQADTALAVRGEHFLTAGMAGTTLSGEGASKPRVVPCRPLPGTQVLGELQDQPQLAVRAVNDRTKTVWIGGGQDWFDKIPAMRRLFRNALVWCMGCGLFNDNFENAFIFIMDDMGCSEHAYSLAWHYPTPGKEDIIKYLVEPLVKQGRVMVQNLTPGYANPATRMVENPWTVPKFTDPFGNVQDYGSTKEGLDEGVRRGVFEIHAHRAWTHLNWDLDSPPGPWWDAPLEGERAHTDWYNETVDARRGLPVPSGDQHFLYKIGRDAIERQFGVTPLGVTVRPGLGLEHDNGRLAAIAGYGVGRWHYLGTDRVIQFSILDMAPEEFSCHDLDLVEKTGPELKTPTQAERERNPAIYRSTRVVGGRVIDLRDPNWIDRWKHKRWIGFNEYCAYLHSHVEASAFAGLTFDIDYDAHYCRHFAKNPSQWTLELSDDYLKKAGQGAAVLVDGKVAQPALARRTVIAIPPGLGRHRVEIRTGVEDEQRPVAGKKGEESASINRMKQCLVSRRFVADVSPVGGNERWRIIAGASASGRPAAPRQPERAAGPDDRDVLRGGRPGPEAVVPGKVESRRLSQFGIRPYVPTDGLASIRPGTCQARHTTPTCYGVLPRGGECE